MLNLPSILANIILIGRGERLMKKMIVGFALLLTSTFSYATAYTCTAYTNGKVVETMTVNASKAVVAEEKAADRLKKKGVNVDYVACK